MINTKDPITVSVIALVVSFLVFLGVLYLAKPKWVQVIDKNGKQSVAPKLVVAFAVTFAIVVAITALLIVSHRRGGAALGPSSSFAMCGSPHGLA